MAFRNSKGENSLFTTTIIVCIILVFATLINPPEIIINSLALITLGLFVLTAYQVFLSIRAKYQKNDENNIPNSFSTKEDALKFVQGTINQLTTIISISEEKSVQVEKIVKLIIEINNIEDPETIKNLSDLVKLVIGVMEMLNNKKN